MENQIDLFSQNLEFEEEDSDLIEDGIELEEIDPEVRLMGKPYDPTLINIDTKTLSLDTLIKKISQPVPEIDLNSKNYFQRNADLWDIGKQSRLIESILIRFPLPGFYFDGTQNKKWLVVDGLQRLSSIRNFVVNKTLKLTNLEFLTQLEGKGFDDLDKDLQRIIEETQVVIYIINPGTPVDVKFNIFKRINTGGLVLAQQEIRHALFQGEPAKFVAELADMQEFKVATEYSISPKRMLDRDFITRFLAFYYFGYLNYTPDLDSFLNKAMFSINKLSVEEKDRIKIDFARSMVLNHKIFGSQAFRKINEVNNKRRPVNKALFDVFSVLFAKLTIEEAKILFEETKMVSSRLRQLLNDDFFMKSISISTSNKDRVIYRFKKVEELIQKLISIQYDKVS